MNKDRDKLEQLQDK